MAGAVGARPEGWPERFDAWAEGWFRRRSSVLQARRFARLRFPRATAGGPGRLPGVGRPAQRPRAFDGPRLVVPPAFGGPARPAALARRRPARSTAGGPPGELAPGRRPVGGRPPAPGRVGAVRAVRDGPDLARAVVDVGRVGRVAATRARPTLWVSQSSADVVEWSFRVGRARVVRTAVLLRGRRLALLGEQWDGPGDPGECG